MSNVSAKIQSVEGVTLVGQTEDQRLIEDQEAGALQRTIDARKAEINAIVQERLALLAQHTQAAVDARKPLAVRAVKYARKINNAIDATEQAMLGMLGGKNPDKRLERSETLLAGVREAGVIVLPE